MRTIAIIQARMGSKRYPGKVLADLGGKSVLQWVVDAAKAAKGVDEVWLALPDTPKDLEIVHLCFDNDWNYICGPEHDVLNRYVDAARASEADIIVRLTGDCPLLRPDLIDRVIELRKLTGADYASNVPVWGDGLDCEVFTAKALERAADEAKLEFDREHVTPYMRCHFYCVDLPLDGAGTTEKLSIDTPEDLENVRRKIASAA